MIRRPLLVIMLVVAAPAAYAQEARLHPVVERVAPSPFVLDVARAAGQPAEMFKQRFGPHAMSSFHYGDTYDVTYWVAGEGLLTVVFIGGRARLFRLITRRGRSSPEALVRLLGVDTAHLELVETRDVKRVWRGRVGGVVLTNVSAVTSPEGWTRAEIAVAGYTDD